MPKRAQTLAGRVRDLLRERGIAQANLAELTGLSPSYLSRLLSGRRKFSLVHVEVIARALDLSPADLVVGTDGEAVVQAMGTYVPRTEFEVVEQRLAAVSTEAETLRAEKEAVDAANHALREQVRALTSERDEARHERDGARRERDVATIHGRQLEASLEASRKEVTTAKASVAIATTSVTKLEQEVAALRASLGKSIRQLNVNYDAWRQASAQVDQLRAQSAHLQSELAKSGDKTALASVITGLVGLGLGVASSRGTE